MALLITLWLSYPAFAGAKSTYCELDLADGSMNIFLLHSLIAFLLFSIFIKVAGWLRPGTKSNQELEAKEDFKNAA